MDMHITTDWPFASLIIGVILLIPLLLPAWPTKSITLTTPVSPPSRFRDPRWYMHLALPLYMLHQFEEHGYDLLGRRYAFQAFICEALGFPENRISSCPATPLVIFFVNPVFVWAMTLLARTRPYSGCGANVYGLIFVNALAHIMPSLSSGISYNPGLLTAWVLFLPGATFAFRALVASGQLNFQGIVRSIAVGALGHVLMLVSFKAFSSDLISEWSTCFLQIANLLPIWLVTQPC